MVPWYHRYLHLARRLAWALLGLSAVSIFVAVMFGVPIDGSTSSQPMSPMSAARNIFTIVPTELHNAVTVLVSGLIPFQGWIFVMGINVGMYAFLFWFMARGTTHLLRPGQYDVRFTDVRGQPEILESVMQVVHLFQGHRQFKQHFGGYPPRGLLFEGPPGTGKTLMAKAIAGECNVPFLYASGAGFANMFLGVPQLKVRGMFKKARKLAEKWGGCVIFIDELDAIGGARNSGGGSAGFFGGGDSMLVNALLTELDGIEKSPLLPALVFRIFRKQAPSKSYNLLVIGATNRAQTLDAALLRPGRFDRKIHVGNPGEEGRRDIIGYYLNKVAHIPIDIDRLAKATAGYSPVQIKTIINEALIFALRQNRDALTYDDIWQAKLHAEVGLVEPTVYSDHEKRIIAIHESGHAIAMHKLNPGRPVQIVTVRKRGDTLGLVHSQETEERHGRQKEEILSDIRVALAGLVAEEIWLGQSSTAPSSDLQTATINAIQMIGTYGMGSTLVSHLLMDGRSMTSSSITLALQDATLRKEVDDVLQACKRDVRALLEEQRRAVEVVRDALLERDELTGDEMRELLFLKGLIPKPPAALVPLPVLSPNGHHDASVGSRN